MLPLVMESAVAVAKGAGELIAVAGRAEDAAFMDRERSAMGVDEGDAHSRQGGEAQDARYDDSPSHVFSFQVFPEGNG